MGRPQLEAAGHLGAHSGITDSEKKYNPRQGGQKCSASHRQEEHVRDAAFRAVSPAQPVAGGGGLAGAALRSGHSCLEPREKLSEPAQQAGLSPHLSRVTPGATRSSCSPPGHTSRHGHPVAGSPPGGCACCVQAVRGGGEDTGFGTHPPLPHPHPQGQSVGLGRSSWGSVCRPLSSVAAGTCPSTRCPSSALAQPGPQQPLSKGLARE